MRFEAEPAFVLHARPWRETSLLVEVLSAEHGRLGLVARGVQGPKRHVLRAALQPLQSIRFDAVQRGELAQLRSAEALDAAPQLHGDAAWPASTSMNCASPGAARRSAAGAVRGLRPGARAPGGRRRCHGHCGASSVTCSRRWASASPSTSMATAMPIDPAARYRLDPEHGPRRLLSDRGSGDRSTAATGRALLALGNDCMPDAEDLASAAPRAAAGAEHHLGGRGLKSWEMLTELARIAPRSG